MSWFILGEDAQVTIDFSVDGQFVVPDAGSVKVTVRDNDGQALPDWNKVDFDVPSTTLDLVIPAAVNTIKAGLIYETRYIRVDCKLEGVSDFLMKFYRVTPFIPMTVTADDVRSILGASEQEVPNKQIDLHMAFYKLQASGQLELLNALKSNTGASLSANKAIALNAALEHLPALGAKLAQSESQDNATRQRMKLDIPQLKKDLMSLLDEELEAMNNLLNGGSTTAIPTLMMLTSPTDVITG